MSGFTLRVQFDPDAAARAHLAAYPADDLWPDIAVPTAGAIAVEIGGQAVAYRRGHLAPSPADASDPAIWLPDYLGGFLPRLAAAVLDLAPGQSTTAHLLDAPAALTFHQEDRLVIVTYVDGGEPIYQARITLGAARAAVARAIADFLRRLLAINPRLAEHPEVAGLLRQHFTLTAGQAGQPLPFSQRMRQLYNDQWRRLLAHPFIADLGSGTLPAERYRFYLAQDYVFLIDYARVLALAVSRAHDLATMTRLAGLTHATLDVEMTLHREACAAFGIGPAELEATRPTPTTHAYTRFLLDLAQRGTLGEIAAGLLPCQRGYAEIANHLATRAAPDTPYADWIAAYTSAEYQELAAWLAGLADRLEEQAGPAERERMATAYVFGLRYEAAFWRMALEGEDWPLD